VVSYRPKIDKLKCEGTITIPTGLDANFIKQALELGGLRFGLLSYRPEFGRFILNKWAVNNNGK
jgi:hypothetical protein